MISSIDELGSAYLVVASVQYMGWLYAYLVVDIIRSRALDVLHMLVSVAFLLWVLYTMSHLVRNVLPFEVCSFQIPCRQYKIR